MAKTYQYFEKKFPAGNRKRRDGDPSLVDCLMACCAVFHLKFPSLLQYDEYRAAGSFEKHNFKTLYYVENAPSDTTMREKLDVLEPSDVRGVFKRLFAEAQRGKVLEQYTFWNGHYLLSIDGTGQYSSNKVRCENCCVKHRGEKNESYYHHALAGVIVHPEMKRVIPIAPEPITKQDGATKNDCEQNAGRRLLQDFRREHPHLQVVVNEDSLYSTGPHVQLLKDLDMRFIIGAKPGNLGTLFDWIKHIDKQEHNYIDNKGTQHRFQFTNGVPLNDTYFDTKVNFLEYWETDKKGKKQHFSWITDIPLSAKTVDLVMRGGRARWRIENETFNTLKNQGYNFEHNYGHGNKNLCTIMGLLMMLAFTIDQLSELCDAHYQKARAAMRIYHRLWSRMQFAFSDFIFSSWDELFETISTRRRTQANTG